MMPAKALTIYGLDPHSTEKMGRVEGTDCKSVEIFILVHKVLLICKKVLKY